MWIYNFHARDMVCDSLSNDIIRLKGLIDAKERLAGLNLQPWCPNENCYPEPHAAWSSFAFLLCTCAKVPPVGTEKFTEKLPKPSHKTTKPPAKPCSTKSRGKKYSSADSNSITMLQKEFSSWSKCVVSVDIFNLNTSYSCRGVTFYNIWFLALWARKVPDPWYHSSALWMVTALTNRPAKPQQDSGHESERRSKGNDSCDWRASRDPWPRLSTHKKERGILEQSQTVCHPYCGKSQLDCKTSWDTLLCVLVVLAAVPSCSQSTE